MGTEFNGEDYELTPEQKEVIEAFENGDNTVFKKHSRWLIWNMKLAGKIKVPQSMETDYYLMVESCKESL